MMHIEMMKQHLSGLHVEWRDKTHRDYNVVSNLNSILAIAKSINQQNLNFMEENVINKVSLIALMNWIVLSEKCAYNWQ